MEDEAARRREERRREREARRRAREEEEAAEEEKRKADRESRRRARRGGDDEDDSRRREEERRQREEEERQRREEEERQQEEEARRRREEEEEEERRRQEEEEERRRIEEEEEEEQRRREEEEEQEERRRLRKEEERRRREEEEEVDAGDEEPEEEPEEESIFDQMSPQKKQGILEGLAAEFHRIVDERDSKSETVTTVTPAELDELDLKVRSLRTQLRKAEELKNNLQKQYKEMEVKINLNEKEVTKLRAELDSAERENELAVKEGRKVVTQRTVTKKAAPKKNQWGGFVNVVRKAQSAAWEDKFKAMKAKQKESGGPEPEWMLKAKKAEGVRAITPVKKDKAQPEKDKPAWAQQQVLRGSAKPKAPWEDKEEKREDKPSWASGGLLRKTERGDNIRGGSAADAEREKRRQDWREKLKKSEGVKSHGAGERKSDEPAFKNVSLRSVRKSEADDED